MRRIERYTKRRQAEAAIRQQEVARMSGSGMKVGDMAQTLGVTRQTIWGDMKQIMANAKQVHADVFVERRDQLGKELDELKRVVLASQEMADVERVAAFLAVVDRVAKLWGLNLEKDREAAKILIHQQAGGKDAANVVEFVRSTYDPAAHGRPGERAPAKRIEETSDDGKGEDQ